MSVLILIWGLFLDTIIEREMSTHQIHSKAEWFISWASIGPLAFFTACKDEASMILFSHTSTCFCFSSTGVKGMCHQAWLLQVFSFRRKSIPKCSLQSQKHFSDVDFKCGTQEKLLSAFCNSSPKEVGGRELGRITLYHQETASSWESAFQPCRLEMKMIILINCYLLLLIVANVT